MPTNRVPEFEAMVRKWVRLLLPGWSVVFQTANLPHRAEVEVRAPYRELRVGYDPSKGTELTELIAIHEVCHTFLHELHSAGEKLIRDDEDGDDTQLADAARHMLNQLNETWTEQLAVAIQRLARKR